jgi:Ca-activated chloride channel family protein
MNLDLTLNPDEFELASPWILLLAIPAVALVVWNYRRKGGAPALVFPSVRRLKGMPRTLRQRTRILIPLLQIAAVLLFVVAAARPQQGNSRTIVQSEGIAIQMVLDRSGSMEEEMKFEGRSRTRIEIVKNVFMDFVTGKGDLPGRKTDLIGLTTFARFPEESCPLVAQHEPLVASVQNLTTVEPFVDLYNQPVRTQRPDRSKHRPNPLNKTAIGDGIMRAVYSLITAEKDLKRGEEEGGYKIKGKVIIILTDGEDNASKTDPVEAGKYALENDIRLYYILMRDRNEYVVNPWTGQRTVARRYSDAELLATPREVAGDPQRAFLATDGDALEKIYEQIDRLERTDIGRVVYRTYDEKYLLFLLPGVGLALLAVLLGETLLRRIP